MKALAYRKGKVVGLLKFGLSTEKCLVGLRNFVRQPTAAHE